MHRLNNSSLQGFVTSPGRALVLFGAPDGDATQIQACAFAECWANHHREARFGHIDAHAHRTARDAYRVRHLPTVLAFENGEVIDRFEGFHPLARLETAFTPEQDVRAA